MTEFSLIFQPESVRGLLAIPPTKTQSRRVVTPQNSLIDGSGKGIRKLWPLLDWSRAEPFKGGITIGMTRITPRTQPGDLVRVRETWRPVIEGYHSYIEYKAGGYEQNVLDPLESFKGLKAVFHCVPGGKRIPGYSKAWHSPLHLPREWSRSWLLISEVRGHRLCETTAGEAEAEGIKNKFSDGTMSRASYALRKFAERWDSINGRKPGRAWADSPLVWAYAWSRVLNRVEADDHLRSKE